MGMFFGCFQQIPLWPDVTFQSHHDFFADGIDGWIGYLGEELLEIVVQHARLVRHHGQSAVVAHRTERIAQFLHQRQQHELHGFRRVAECLHAWQQVGLV